MKAKFDLSQIMTRAWAVFRSRIYGLETFGDCLRHVWSMAKGYAESGKTNYRYGVLMVNTTPALSRSWDDAIAADYGRDRDEYGRKRYFAD